MSKVVKKVFKPIKKMRTGHEVRARGWRIEFRRQKQSSHQAPLCDEAHQRRSVAMANGAVGPIVPYHTAVAK